MLETATNNPRRLTQSSIINTWPAEVVQNYTEGLIFIHTCRMGAGASKAASSITRQQLLASTTNGRDHINKLFLLMLSKLTPEDLLKLNKSQTCSSYVFLMANSIGHIFQDLQVRPRTKTDTGVIYFEKLDTLKAQTTESRELCLFVSYFFIRIFQIFGAVAMTILDDPGAGQILGAVHVGHPQVVDPRRIPGARGAYLSGGAESKHFMSGNARMFASIRELLDDPELETTTRGTPRAVFSFLNLPNVQIIPERIDERGRPQNMRIEIDGNSRIYANMKLAPILQPIGQPKKIKIAIEGFRYVDSHKDAQIVGLINRQILQYKTSFDITSPDSLTWYSGSQPFEDKLNGIIYKVQGIIQELESNPAYTLANLKLLTKEEKGFVPGATAVPGMPGMPGMPGAIQRHGSRDVAVIRSLQNEYIVNVMKQLAGSKTTAFCVARAIQLIDANTLYNPKSTMSLSGVCKPIFEPMGSSLPQAKQSLEKIPGFKALDQLFYTRPGLDQRGEFSIQVGDIQAYTEFLKDMNDKFGRPGQVTDVSKIMAKDPNCATNAANKYLQLQDPNEVQKVLGVVGRMFMKQKAHTERAIKFLNMRLFTIKTQKDGRLFVDLSPKLLQNGMIELAQVSKEARLLLIDYYKGCEDLYQEGARIVLSARSIPV